MIAAGAARVMYTSVGHLHGLDVTTASDTDYGGGPDFIFFGGAFSPDGTRFAYVRATGTTEASLRVITLADGSAATIRNFPDLHYDVPKVWTDRAMASVEILGFSEPANRALTPSIPPPGYVPRTLASTVPPS